MRGCGSVPAHPAPPPSLHQEEPPEDSCAWGGFSPAWVLLGEAAGARGGGGRLLSRGLCNGSLGSLHAAPAQRRVRTGVGEAGLVPPEAFLPLSMQLTVQLTMSSPGAPPPPLSPEGATEGAVRQGTQMLLVSGECGNRSSEPVPVKYPRTDAPLQMGPGFVLLTVPLDVGSGVRQNHHQIPPLPLTSCVS